MPSFAFKGALVAVVMVFTYSALLPSLQVQAVDGVESSYFPTVVEDFASHRVGFKTDDETVKKEAETTKPDGFSQKELDQLAEGKEDFEFQAEVSRLMDIIINSLYQKKEIFLRELLSNASDALDKIRFLALSEEGLLGDKKELEIRIKYDKDENSVTITDSGIGMTKQDLIENLGTVAKSGTTQFVEALTGADGDMSLIGQFGVGFYSVYLVADKVRVTSKHNEDKQHIWESTADATFSVAADPRGNTLGRGTEIKLFLKEDAAEYTNQQSLEDLVKRYSEFITFPIHLYKSSTETYEVPVEEDADDDGEDADDGDDEDDDEEEDDEDDEDEDDDELDSEDEEEEDDEEEIEYETKTRTVWNWDLVNKQKAIWSRDKKEVTDEDYENFYKAISKDHEGPTTWTHFKAEGEIEFKSILFVPKKASHDQYDNYYKAATGLRLYVRKVLITDEFEDLLPQYLNFVKGVIDSDDLPLNVSRETLQQHKVLKVMGKKLVRKCLEMLRKLSQKAAKDAEKEAEEKDDDDKKDDDEKAADKKDDKAEEKEDPYVKFWEEFGKSIKLGLVEDSSNRTKLSKLLRFKTSKSDGKWVSLEQYVENMKEDQEHIYYVTGESLEAVQNSPFLEQCKARDLEVLFLTEPIDEYAVQNLTEFDGKRLMSVTKEGLKFGGDEDVLDGKREKLYKEKFDKLTTFLKDTYGKAVEKVAISNRLEATPCVLVTSQYGYSANMERIMKSQAFSDAKKSSYLFSKKTMEINPRHPIIVELNNRVSGDGEITDEVKDLALVLLDTALINSGFHMEDSRDFSQRMYRVMKSGLGLKSLELADHIEVPAEPETSDDDGDEDEEELFDDDDDDAPAAKDEPRKAEAKDEPRKAEAKDEPRKAEAKDEPRKAEAKDEPRKAEAKDEPRKDESAKDEL